ncbi:MAG: 2OG-Fe(II) oxygenase [Bacteriovoracaceae bacterium]|nr:2OG-Fe(II) oxygenase [Bacteriovoracaceae bacterium]
MKEFKNGYIQDILTLPDELKSSVSDQDWGQTDAICQTLAAPGGAVYECLRPFANQKRLEFIISVRDSKNDWEEDGIWHDDGSRPLAFSLGLNINPDIIEGGELLLRKKNSEQQSVILPPKFGEIIIFNTGVSGYEHKVRAVTTGHRVVMAGWCYDY